MSDYNFQAQVNGFTLNIDLFEVQYDAEGMWIYKDAYVELYDKDGVFEDACNSGELFDKYKIDIVDLAENHDQDLYDICQKKADEHNYDSAYDRAADSSYDLAHAYD